MKGYLFLEYPACGTCRKAKKWLDGQKVNYTDRHIVEERPTREELKMWFERSGLPLRKFFNTSGLLYKSMQLKEKLDEELHSIARPLEELAPGDSYFVKIQGILAMSEDEQLELLASDGKLVKRPLVIGEDFVLLGFKLEEWEKVLLK